MKEKTEMDRKMNPFREGLFEVGEDGAGRLLTHRCERCGVNFFPRRKKCIRCQRSDRLKETSLSRNGKLYTYTTVYQAFAAFPAPYMIGYVDFEEEGLRVFAQLTGCTAEELEVGREMELVFEALPLSGEGKEKITYKFRPVR